MRRIKRGKTSVILEFVIDDTSSTTGGKLTGVLYSAITAYYIRSVDSAPVAIPLVAGTIGAYASGGFKQVSASLMPGLYQLCVPDAAFASGEWVSICIKGATNMAPIYEEIQLVAVDDQDSAAFGLSDFGSILTSLPAIEARTSLIPDSPASIGSQMALDMTQSVPIENDANTLGNSLTHYGNVAKIGDEMTLTEAAYDRITGGVLDAKIASHEQEGSVGEAIIQPAAVAVDSSAIAESVWSYSARSLTTFGSLAAEMWAVALETVKSASGSIGKYILDRLTQVTAPPDAIASSSLLPASGGEIVAGIDLATAQKMLNAWKDAELAVAVAGQSYQLDIGGNKRVMTRANLAEIQAQIKYWRRQVADLSGKRRIGYVE